MQLKLVGKTAWKYTALPFFLDSCIINHDSTTSSLLARGDTCQEIHVMEEHGTDREKLQSQGLLIEMQTTLL